MPVTLISTPEPVTSPALNSKWLATESPNNFRLQRKDFAVTAYSENTGSPAGCLVVTVTSYTGTIGNSISVYDVYSNSMFVGQVVDIDGSDVLTDIPWNSNMVIEYLNDHTLFAGYYFEGRLTINDVVHPITIKASPDSKGFADLDVSGLLRTSCTIGKIGNYDTALIAETNKSGNFLFDYRECWYGSDEIYHDEGTTWYYTECVRSEEQGSNLYDYVATSDRDAPFFNLFSRPVYFKGYPFDISFLMTNETFEGNAQFTIGYYDSNNNILGNTSWNGAISSFQGKMASLLVDPTLLPSGTVEIRCNIEI